MKTLNTILVLGGYGATGRIICRYLLREMEVKVIIAGRNLAKATELARDLGRAFSPERVSARFADASDRESLRQAFAGVDLVLVAASTTHLAQQIAEVALESQIDYLDIYYAQGVYPVLESLGEQIEGAGRCFITQAGFHPGLPAAFVRQGAGYFDRYQTALVAFAMDIQIENSESVHEILDSLADYHPEIYRDGQWLPASYRDALQIDFGPRLGVRSCVPLDMVEIKPLPDMFDLKDTGVYAAGFNWFIDWLLFPLMMFSHRIKPGFLRDFWAKLFIFGLNRFSGREKGVVFLLQAAGEKDGQPVQVQVMAEHDSGYELTAIPVISCLKQIQDGAIGEPGLWMMGHIVNPERLLADMAEMGVKIQTSSH